jgi:hypothetical protein
MIAKTREFKFSPQRTQRSQRKKALRFRSAFSFTHLLIIPISVDPRSSAVELLRSQARAPALHDDLNYPFTKLLNYQI